jgi:hypothetical protein
VILAHFAWGIYPHAHPFHHHRVLHGKKRELLAISMTMAMM